jgi:membrane associated rhomboid family serine protease
MRFKEQLERKLSRFAIPHLTLWIIAGQVLFFMLHFSHHHIMDRLYLEPALVMMGQWWRIFSFVFIPPSYNPLWLFLDIYFFFLIGNALENTWGSLHYNLFLLIGWVATVAAAFLVPGGAVASLYLFGSVFLAFAFLFPDFLIYVAFVLPVRVKYIAWLAWAFYGWMFLNGDWPQRVIIVAAVLNFLLFFRRDIVNRIRYGHRKMIQKAVSAVDEPFHRCSICGMTERTNPEMEFRYCNLCVGTPCYCINHINAHEHRVAK